MVDAVQNLPQLVIKRSGEKVAFDINKISWAIKRCLRSQNEDTDKNNSNVVDIIKKKLCELNTQEIAIEQLQDLVQYSIYEAGLEEASMEYVMFRERKALLREKRPIPEDVRIAFAESEQYFKNPIQQFQFLDKYSRFDYDKGRRETWVETVDRCMEYFKHLSQNKLTNEDYEEIKKAILNLEVMPSMRSLAAAGKNAIRNPASIYNCSVVCLDCVESFSEIMFLSMSGCGVGYTVEKKYINNLPVVKHLTGEVVNFVVPDTSEGWADCVKFGMSNLFNGVDVNFDFSLLRAAGAKLRTKGGSASGPMPLIKLMAFIKKIMFARQGLKLRPIDAHDIACEIGNASICGAYRRTALIALFDIDDQEMLSCKDGDFEIENPQRWNANNSAVWPEEGITKEQIIAQMQAMVDGQRGEPGIFNELAVKNTMPSRRTFSKNAKTNPCYAPGTLILTKDGHFPIEQLVGKTVTVWNGTAWQEIDNFRVTGINQKLIEIEMQDGSYLKVTPYHTMILDDNSRIEAKDLKLGDKLKVHQAPIVHGTVDEKGAYLKGFLIADGTANRDRPMIYLYQPKYVCSDRLLKSAQELDIDYIHGSSKTELNFTEEKSNKRKLMQGLTCREHTTLFKWASTYKNGLPTEIFAWNLRSKLDFIAGIMDGDGCAADTRSGFKYQLCSTSKNLLLDLQNLLKTIGVQSKISLNKTAGKKDFNDGYGEYNTQDLWRLNIAQEGSIILSKQIKFARLVSFADKKMYFYKTINRNTVVGLKLLDEVPEVYCCTIKGSNSLAITQGYQVGNCAEILIFVTPQEINGGGGQLCNLSSVVVRAEDTKESLLQKVKLATILGTIQSMATDFVYLRPEWKIICEKERLLGVDLNSQSDNKLCQDSEFLNALKNKAIETNFEYADLLGINRSAAITTEKPSGNSSVFLNSSSGIHARFAPYYIRNVRINVHTPLYKVLRDAGVPMSLENGQTKENVTTMVIHFPVAAPKNAIFRKDQTVIDQLEIWKNCKLNWAEHNVSCTINYKPEEVDSMLEWVCNNADIIGGLSFLPYSNAKYNNMPYEEITEEEYNKKAAEFPHIDFSKIYQYEFDDQTEASQTLACVAGSCET